jgi:hypothetical protein
VSRDFVAYRLPTACLDLVPAEGRRRWMDESPGRFAYRCLPLLIANESGWTISNGARVTATWNGGSLAGDCTIEHEGVDPPLAHFGSGLVTWRIPYLFRTPPGWNLLMRGPANEPKDGASSLEGVIEADWATQPAFHTWKLTRVGHPVTWEEGEPLCMILPQRRGELESWRPRMAAIGDDQELDEEYQVFSESRSIFNETRPREWQKHYFLGRSPGSAQAPAGEHQTKLQLRPFEATERSASDSSGDRSEGGEKPTNSPLVL